jgi:hypothetical protein
VLQGCEERQANGLLLVERRGWVCVRRLAFVAGILDLPAESAVPDRDRRARPLRRDLFEPSAANHDSPE